MDFSFKDLRNILFIDIETVSAVSDFEELSPAFQKHWAHKAQYLGPKKGQEPALEEIGQLFKDKAGIFAEFSKIVCISVGYLKMHNSTIKGVRLKSFTGHDEKELLENFGTLLDNYYPNPNKYFICGHNIKEFDIPFICRRMIVNGIRPPKIIDVGTKKSWQTPQFLDTLEYWKFGDYKHYTSLDLLMTIFNIPSPKDDIDGSQVGKVYWEENDLDRIGLYCEKDVLSVIKLFLKFQFIEDTTEFEIIKENN